MFLKSLILISLILILTIQLYTSLYLLLYFSVISFIIVLTLYGLYIYYTPENGIFKDKAGKGPSPIPSKGIDVPFGSLKLYRTVEMQKRGNKALLQFTADFVIIYKEEKSFRGFISYKEI